jgi:hypothetical protein
VLVFDEVDAGIGGRAADAVGHALARLGERSQVIVVTHLAQVAARAGRHLSVSKAERSGRTVSTVAALDGEARVLELGRMLAGDPDSEVAQLIAQYPAERLKVEYGTKPQVFYIGLDGDLVDAATAFNTIYPYAAGTNTNEYDDLTGRILLDTPLGPPERTS